MNHSHLLKFIAGYQPILNMEHGILSAPVRHIFMIACVWYLTKKNPIKNLQILEVGSWIGASTLSWAQGLNEFNQAQGAISCIDAWQPFFDRQTHQEKVYHDMELALGSETAYQLYLHNVGTIPNSITCQHLRGQSANLLPLLRENTFDIIFIDGDHRYQAVLKDIELSLSLVKESGIICGDDLNLQLFQVDQAHADHYREYDFIHDPKTKHNFHPGVTLAVHEIFNEVSVWGGFWAMQRQKNQWQKISLKGMPTSFPKHFPTSALKKAEDHLKDIEIL